MLSCPPRALDLPGPSRRVRIEPLTLPDVLPPAPAEPAREGEPAPAPAEREAEPAAPELV